MSAGFSKTTRRVRTRRGVVWLGQTCNLRCRFCYFQTRVATREHPDHPFMSLDKARAVCSTLRGRYGNTAVDIQGGEPTIYPQIEALVAHCREIGLLPTLITNAVALDDPQRCRRLKQAGLRDLLVSVHGLGAAYDEAVGLPGAHARQMKALDNLAAEAIPFRLNCVLASSVLPDLAAIARLAVERGARVMNFIAFNPFEDQQGARSGQDVHRYSEVAGPLADALDHLEANGLEANVRYLPLCVAQPRHRKNFYNFQQLPYDLHEWDYASWSWSGRNPQRRRDGELEPPITLREANRRSKMFGHDGYLEDASVSVEDEYRHSALIRAREHCGYRFAPACAACALKDICDGFHGDYSSLYGADEASAQDLPGISCPVGDPRHLIREQVKIVEDEDASWAL
ncbi:radical SAM protein [Fundidesulfovibrio agrisoli]|uniref:radical SAM protein n=1 Tax=Fundidesulfovibrio agrisoli TaxID=2922717 RepID=UPI001FABB3C6|nr:radical SAM protein [Fundidesulfovibrio agrisoli]